MNIVFEKMDMKHATGVMKIYNHYADKSTAAFPQKAVPEHFYVTLLKRCDGYPAYAMVDKNNNQVAGFSLLSAYNPLPTFKNTACFTCFIAPEYTGKGLGSLALTKIEEDSKSIGLKSLISDISSDNNGSIRFHEKHGFTRTGELKGIGEKFGRKFSITLMQKML